MSALPLDPQEVRAILTIKLSSIGDVADTTPALRALRKSFPRAWITHVVEKTAAPLLAGSPYVHELLVFDRERALALLPGHPFRALAAFVSELRKTIRKVREVPYDLAIDFQGLARSVIFLYRARAEAKIGRFGWRFLTARLPRSRKPVLALREYVRQVEMAGGRAHGEQIEIAPTNEDSEATERLLARHGIGDGKPCLLVAPITRWKSKDWGEERFRELGSALVERGYRCVFVGAPRDRDAIERIAGSLQGAVNLAGELPLAGLVPLARACSLTLTCDTGPMHVVAAAGKPIVAIYGPTDPARSAPPGTRVVRSSPEVESVLAACLESLT